jgi:hypothetical protein
MTNDWVPEQWMANLEPDHLEHMNEFVLITPLACLIFKAGVVSILENWIGFEPCTQGGR